MLNELQEKSLQGESIVRKLFLRFDIPFISELDLQKIGKILGKTFYLGLRFNLFSQ